MITAIAKRNKCLQNSAKSKADPAPENISIEDEFIDRETRDIDIKRISEALSKLTVRQREVILYRFYENMSLEEISVLMGMNRQSVQNLLQRTLKKLRTEPKAKITGAKTSQSSDKS